MNKQDNTTRRNLLKGAAGAALLGYTAAAMHSTAVPVAAAAATEEWDMEADVVVVGTGCAGLAAAIEAADNGASVIVLEKMSEPGGTTAMAGGSAAVPTQERLDEAISYFMACGRGKVDRDMIRAWADEAIQLKDWMSGFGEIAVSPRTGYYQEFPGANSLEGLSPALGAGPQLIEMMVEAAEARGVEILLETPVVALVATPEKEVHGVEAEHNGAILRVKANKGVVLAAGGLHFNEELKLQFGRAWPKYGTGSPGCTGDGLLMGMNLGAAIWKTAENCGRPCIKIDEYEVAYGFGLLGQPCVIVNKYGKRFVREDISYDAFHMALDPFDPVKSEFTNLPFYAIFDEALRLQRPVGVPGRVLHGLPPWSPDNSEEIEKGWIVQAESIAELAIELGIDPTTLRDTVAIYNHNIETAGADPEFGRTGGLEAVKTPPFYAVKGHSGLYGTWASLKINTGAHVIDVNDNVIPRLYAAGENAIGSLGVHYPTGGNCIADGLAFGRIAGRNAAAEEPLA